MSPRTGRPPKENPRKSNLNIRLLEEEYALLQQCAQALGVTKTEVVVKGIRLVEAETKK